MSPFHRIWAIGILVAALIVGGAFGTTSTALVNQPAGFAAVASVPSGFNFPPNWARLHLAVAPNPLVAVARRSSTVLPQQNPGGGLDGLNHPDSPSSKSPTFAIRC